MRLIDADALKGDYVVTSTTTNSLCNLYVSMEQIAMAPTVEPASPWHRVEEPPEMKETKELPGFFMSGLCILFDRYSKAFDLGYATRSNYMGGGIKWHSVYAARPTHWMPIEPPKEDA